MANILLISDNEIFRADVSEQLKLYASDFEVYSEDNNTIFDVVILDTLSEKMKDLQIKMNRIPIVLLLPQGGEADSFDNVRVINKPIVLENLLDALHSMVNIFANNDVIKFNQYCLNSGSKEITNFRNGEVVKLTEREISIIKYLYKAQGEIVSKAELLSEVWGYSSEASTHTVETHIYRLRQKVEHDNKEFQIIVTEDNGYKLKLQFSCKM